MSSLRSLSLWCGLLALSLGSIAGCEMPRPKGFTPTRQIMTPPNADAFSDGGADVGGATGSILRPPDELPDSGTPVLPGSPLGKLQGYYYLRTDIEFTYSQTSNLTTLTVFNRESHFILTRLVADGEALKAVERTCHIFYQHECKRSCDNFSTSIAKNAASLYRQDLRRVYTLTSGGKGFVTDATQLLLGWKGPASPLPASPSDSSLWVDKDSGARGFYIRVHTDGLPRNPLDPGSSTTLDCEYTTVQRIRSDYRGMLASDGSLGGVNAELSRSGSGARQWYASGGGLCSVDDNAAAPNPSRSTARFVRIQPSDKDAFWDCPSQATFTSKLPDP